MKYFRQLPVRIDPTPLLAQLAQYDDLWNYDDSWTRYKPTTSAIYNTDNIVLRYNRSTRPDAYDWSRPASAVLTEAWPIIRSVMHAIWGEMLGKVVITRLRPGESIEPHTDWMPLVPGSATQRIPLYFQRYQIPLNEGCKWTRFIVGNEVQQMLPGSVWWFNNQVEHAVYNDGALPRISMLTDIRPFTPYGGSAP